MSPGNVRKTLQSLSPERLELLARRLKKKEAPAPLPPIPRLERQDGGGTFPLSFAQQRMWFLYQLEPESPFYNESFGLRLRGRLDVAALQAALGEIVRRHETLRTRFLDRDGEPVQTISPPAAGGATVPVADLTGVPAAVRLAEALAMARHERRQPFDLGRGAALRLIVLRLGDEDQVLIGTIHHIAGDTWSIVVLVREISALYEALVAGRPASLPPLPVQVADFAVWQRAQLSGAALESLLGYWRERLTGLPPVLDLPADRPRPAVQRFRGARQPIAFPRELSDRIKALTREQDATLYMVLLAAFEALLARLSGQEDVAVGSPVASRGRAELEGLIGCFVNMLVLRGDLSGGVDFRTLLARTRTAALGAFTHQDIPFELLVEHLQPERSRSHTPLFQTVLSVTNTPTSPLLMPGIEAEDLPPEGEVAKFDLVLFLAESGEGIRGSAEYDSDLFDRSTVIRWLGAYETLLDAATADPGTAVADLPLLSPAERHQILAEWNDTAGAFPEGVTLTDLFAAAAARAPEAVAVLFDGAFGEERLSYAELDALSARIAHQLRSLGAGRGTFVAVFLERSLEMVPALLGVLRSGAAYVPLEPAFPRARIEWIFSALGIRHAVTQTGLVPRLAGLGTGPLDLVCLDPGTAPSAESAAVWTRDGLSRWPATAPATGADPGDLAYVIFTSGSTGTPKGVMVRHRPVVNLIDWIERSFGMGPGDRVLFLTSLCFDLSVYDVFGLLAAGGSIRVVGDAEVRDPERLLSRLRREPVTFWDSAPAALQQLAPLMAEAGPAAESRLRLVFLSGDWIPVRLPDTVRSAFPGARVIALGGATEATVWSNSFAVGELPPEWPSIPYGRPMSNARYHVLDGTMRPVPIGVAGDLYIGGECLFTAYAEEPALTAGKLLPDPLGEEPGGRLYRTGDRARHWVDGTLEFLGRADHQVKVRGFRIELGEVEAALVQHPGIEAAVAMVREDSPGERRLVAYVVGSGAGAPGPAALRTFLGERLPVYMVPTAFVALPALPVTANGKLDRKALPAPAAPVLTGSYVAPRTPAEEVLAAVWAEVLRLERVGVHDNFFELGGESILSIQTVARAARAGYRVTTAQIFQYQTVAELAKVAERAEPGVADGGAGPVRGEVPLTPIQRWFFAQDLADPHHFNQAVLLSLRRPIRGAALAAAMAALLGHHDALRLRFRRGPGGWVQENAAEETGRVFLEVDLSALPSPRRAAAQEEAATAAQGSLGLAEGPLVRALLFRRGEEPSRLLVAVHHLAVDGVSWRILLEDLHLAVAEAEAGQAPVLPARTVSYQQWARSQAEEAAEAGSGPGPVEAAGTAAAARTASVWLDPETTRAALQAPAQAYRMRVHEALLTALALAGVPRFAPGPLRVDLEGHGRDAGDGGGGEDLSRTVGWFTTLATVALDSLPAEPGAALKAVKEQVRAAQRRRFDGRLTGSEVLFNYLGQLDQALPAQSLFAAAGEPAGSDRSGRQRRSHPLEASAAVVEGRLRLDLVYPGERFTAAEMEELASRWLESVRRLVEHCLLPEAGGLTPSDVPLARLGQEALDRLPVDGRTLEDLYPLTPLQQGMLFHSVYSPEEEAYLDQVGGLLKGDLDAAAFERAWAAVCARHSVLRTGFLWEGLDEPLQLVHRHAALSLELLDWRHLAPGTWRDSLAALLAEERRRGVDLARPPLMRAALARLGEREHAFAWTFHHLLLDGWSLPVLLGEVFTLYEAEREGLSAALPPAPAYRDYVRWLQGLDPAASEAYWRRALAGFTAATPLGVDRRPDAAAPAVRAEEQLSLPAELSQDLQGLAARHHLTLGTLLQGAWGLLLARYAGEDDVVFGATVAGRPAALPGVESMVGLFINTLPVRVGADPGAEVWGWWAGLQERQAAQREHEHTPLPQIQRWSEVPAGTPLFESILVFENYPAGLGGTRPTGSSLRLEELRTRETTNYPLTLLVAPGAETGLSAVYDARRFDAPSVVRLLGHLGNLLAGAAAGAARLADLPLLAGAERRQVLEGWNDTARSYPGEPLLHRLLEAQAARTPGGVAVLAGDGELTYRELHRRAGRLARHLRALGVGPDRLVGVCAERSAAMVVALLAVLKAGGAYVPLDPEYPRDRLAVFLEDAAPRVVLVQAAVRDRLPEAPGATVLVLDGAGLPEDGDGEVPEVAAPEVAVHPDHLAYAIFTSGSTGRPKGAMNTHRAIVNRLLWMQEAYGLTTADSVLQKTPFGFDVSVWEFFWPLLTGARLVMARPGGHRDPEYLVREISARGITTLHFVPSLLQVFLDEPGAGACRSLKRVIASGEALPAELQERFFAVLDAELHNLYGPTEAAVDVTAWACRRQEAPSSVPIGRPIANLRIHLVDRWLGAVPALVPGELLIGGAGLARGYVGRPGLTAERFVPDPFGASGERLYRTGDLARRLPDGTLEFLGRLDHQVKIRGFRVELGEVENVLLTHPEVQQAAVILREDGGSRRLVAFLSVRGSGLPPLGELRAFLEGRLPEPMIPAAFVALDELPLTPSGKVDRRALARLEPGRDSGRLGPDARFVPARPGRESTLAALWAEVLGVAEVGAHDNFFELGGDSILSLQLVSRARRHGLRFAPRDLFENPTVAGLARAVREDAVAAEQGPVQGPVPLTPIQHRFFSRPRRDPHHFNQSLLLEVPWGEEPQEDAVAALVRHHDALRHRFTAGPGGWRQEATAPEGPTPFSRIDLSALPEAVRRGELEQGADRLQASLDLEHGPVFRAVFFHRGAGEAGRLLLAAHHLVVDGVSWRILLEDLETARRQLARGLPVALPEKTTSFKEWADRLAAHAGSGGFRAEQEAWREIAAAAPPLPRDLPGGDNRVAAGRTLTRTLDAATTRALLQEVPAVYRTEINDGLLTALARTFAAWTGEWELRVDLEGHGREAIFPGVDLTRTVGWFTTLFPVRLALTVDGGPGEHLRQVKEQLRQIPGKGLGFGALLGLDPEAGPGLRALPASEVSFNYLGRLDAALPGDASLRPAREGAGRLVSPRDGREHLLDVHAAVTGDGLSVHWSYSASIHREATVAALADTFLAELAGLVQHCRSAEAGGFTPSDFPLARLEPAELDRLLGRDRSVEDLYPLSPLQQGLLFHSLYTPGSRLYFEQFVGAFDGDLDEAALDAAWQTAAERYAVLRTAFLWQGLAEPLQVVRRGCRLPFEPRDLRGEGRPERELLEAFLEEDRARGFDLGEAPLARLTLLRISKGRTLLVFSFHHLLLDGWSLARLLGEVLALYAAHRTGREARLAPPRPFRDSIAWLGRRETGEAEAYWRRELGGVSASTPLTIDRPPRPGRTARHAAARREASLPAPRAAALQALARRCRVTLSVLVQGAWALLLSRYSGQEDVVFGITLAGRPDDLDGAEQIVGLLINTLPLRVRVPERTPASGWWRELHDRQIELLRHQATPLAQAQAASGVPAGTPLFETLFVFENYPVSETVREHAGTGFTALEIVETPSYPLALVAIPGEPLRFEALFDAERFDAAAVERLLGHLEALLEGFLDTPEAPVGELSPLTAAEREEAVRSARPAASAPVWALHERFRREAARRPDAVALTAPGESWTYGRLDAWSNRLARRLRELGAGPETVVGVCLERSPELVATLLAVLKAGGAYLPLEPDLPVERLGLLLAETRAPLVVTRSGLADRFGALPEPPAQVCLDDGAEQEALARAGEAPLPEESDPGHLAYVLYTSGSTGRPKGVLVTHANVARLLTATEPWFGFGPGDVWTFFHSFAFDFSVWEIFGALLTGGRLVVVPYLVSRSPEAFLELLERERVTVLNQTPSAFRQLSAADAAEGSVQELALREILFGGEALERHHFEGWLARRGDRRPRLVNLYGITETTVHVTYRPLSPADAGPGRRSLVGGPIPDLTVQLLDRSGRPVPVGIPGELCVGGAGLARGYLGQPDRTAERFVPDPLSGVPGARLYRSGDLALRQPDGDLAYLGRIDHQVKIRGFRIELGEIETALAKVPGVAACAVAAREDGPGERRLVAYVVAGSGGAPAVEELRGSLAAVLPEHMLPHLFVFLPDLPLTANGKVDRRALPAPGTERPDLSGGFVPPATPTEQALAALWCEVLGLSRVGRDDHFFLLGGDSILSLRVLSGARERGWSLSLQQVFEHPALRGLAAAVEAGLPPVEEAGRTEPFSLVSPADREALPAEAEDAYPLTFLQAGMLFHSEYEPESALYHDVFSFRLEMPFDAAALREALALTASRHPVLRTSFHLTGFGEPLQLVHREAEIPLSVEDLSSLEAGEREAAVAAAVAAFRAGRFEWGRPPLLRLSAQRLDPGSFQLTLAFHHALLDGWSVASWLTELFQVCSALREGRRPETAPVLAAFRDFVALERQAQSSAESEAFWEERLAALDPLPLPRRGEGSGRAPAGRSREAAVPPGVSAGLNGAARKAGVPLKSVLLAVHLRALSFVTGSPDVVTGLVVSGRPEGEHGERVLGLFLNTVPFGLSLSGGTWLDLAAAAFAAERDLLPHRRYPLACLQRARDLRLDTGFNFTHFHVYRELAAGTGLPVRGELAIEETNFPFAANFGRAVDGESVSLRVVSRSPELAEDEAEALRGIYERLLASLAAGPEGRYDGALPLSASEIHQILVEWNDTAVPDGALVPFHVRVSAWARKIPGEPAVSDGEAALTYAELDVRSGRLAHALQRRGVGPDVVVGVCLDSTVALPLAFLAILKSGGCYLPLDPGLPAERLAWMVEEARPALVLTRKELAGRLGAAAELCVFLEGLEEAESAPLDPVPPDALAYVIFTSGSTGRPKGVLVPHRGLANVALTEEETLGLKPGDRVLQVLSLAFDGSIFQMVCPLSAGATLVLAPGEDRPLADGLLRLVARERITSLTVTPSILRTMPFAELPELRTLALAGEPLPPGIAERWAPGRRMLNLYGPTEASISSTSSVCRPGEPVSIGRPISGVRALVLDGQGLPVPPGTPGELCVGGLGVARGYLGSPDLTAVRFVPDPHAGRPGARLYRTGDRVRRRGDGALEFLGRIDDQVKVRGVRIEPGEIEAVLGEHPGVLEAAVALHPDRSGEPELVGYVVLADGPSSPLPADGLRAYLLRRLPAALVPGRIVPLDALPRGRTGKLDRKALPPPGAVAVERPPSEPPRTPLERVLASLFREVLGVEEVGAHDNFFEQGGHSITATRLAARVRETLVVELPLRRLFENPTVAGLAQLLLADGEDRPRLEQTAEILLEIAGLSDEEADLMLSSRTGGEPGAGSYPA